MASKLVFNKDFKRRNLLLRRKKHYLISKVSSNDLYIPIQNRNFISNGASNLKTSRIKNRCVISGRSKAVYSFLKLSRMTFKKLAVEGQMVGIKKASW